MPLQPPELQARIDAGNEFNKRRQGAYPLNEVTVGYGSGSARLDSYIPNKEIVSRKYSQLALIKESTVLGYLQEIERKYPEGAEIVQSGRNVSANAGRRLAGKYVLEVPAQTHPVPTRVLEAARRMDIIIRDENGKQYR